MITAAQIEAMHRYKALLEEMKTRLEYIDTLRRSPKEVHPKLVREGCYLQLRMICELIAFGCLVVHGELVAEQARSLLGESRADFIANKLSKLRPEFYPQPQHRIRTTKGWHCYPETKPFLTKEKLVELDRVCGGQLHRGGVEKVFGPVAAVDYDHQDIADWTRLVRRLLVQHAISVAGEYVFVNLFDDAGQVQVVWAQPPN